jgi:hypothetical protein
MRARSAGAALACLRSKVLKTTPGQVALAASHAIQPCGSGVIQHAMHFNQRLALLIVTASLPRTRLD